MKKIICAICGLSMICGTALADEMSVVVDLNTPIRWYENAIREAFAYIVGFSGESSEYLERQKQAIHVVSNSFNTANGIVTASPAELINKCTQILNKNLRDDEIARLCAKMVTQAIRKHNSFVKSYTQKNIVSIDDINSQICWSQKDFRPRIVFGDKFQLFWDVFYDDPTWSLYDCAKLSLAEMRTRCESILGDSEIAKSLNTDSSTCQKFVEDTVNTHNNRIIEFNSLQLLQQ